MTENNNFDSSFENKWCPGCGNFGILNALKKALIQLNMQPHQILIVSGIGQAAKTPHFLRCNMFHGLHGRALPLATGAKTANHDLTIIVTTGDGDCYGEGGNHFIHAIRRNIDITLLTHNNKVYGLTKGQASPTSDSGMITKAQPQGVNLESYNPLSIALALNAGFIARGYVGHMDHLSNLIRQGIQHRGFSFIDILQVCVSFNNINTYDWYNSRVYELEKEGYNPTEYLKAIEKAREWGERIPIGLLYKTENPSFTDKTAALKQGTLIERTYDPTPLRKVLSDL